MCGIWCRVGLNPAGILPIEATRIIQYRGYDSAGIVAYIPDIGWVIQKQGLSNIGKTVDEFLAEVERDGRILYATLALTHTRWATHGKPNDINAHPHEVGNIILVHNGTNNYHEKLVSIQGDVAVSDTDTERIGLLIDKLYDGRSLVEATIEALKSGQITGPNALALVSKKEPNKIVAAQINKRPLYIGIDDNGEATYVCSDIPTLVTLDIRKQVPIESGEVAELTPDGYTIYDLQGNRVSRNPFYNRMLVRRASKGDYEHFMLKEIAEQGEALKDAQTYDHDTVLEVMNRFVSKMINTIQAGNHVYLVGSGTSSYAAQFGTRLFRSLGIITESVIGQDLKTFPVKEGDAVLAISQSGETNDIIRPVDFAKKTGAEIFSLVNVPGSSLTRDAVSEDGQDNNIYLNCGPENAVVATKSFLSQIYRFIEMYEIVAERVGKPEKIIPGARETLPQLVQETIDRYLDGERFGDFIDLAIRSRTVETIGLGLSYPIALEGALKLKETAYVPDEGVFATELKHGPISLFDPKNSDSVPLIAIAAYDNADAYSVVETNIREVKARNGIVASVVRDDDTTIKKISNYSFPVPNADSPYGVLLSVIPLQLFGYHVAKRQGYPIDKPRNLAKSVTVD